MPQVHRPLVPVAARRRTGSGCTGPGCTRWGYAGWTRTAVTVLTVLAAVTAALTAPAAAVAPDERPMVADAVGGRPVAAHATGGAPVGTPPWMAAVVDRAGPTIVPRCGGTVVDERWVLTAGHCVADQAVHRLGIVIGAADPRSGPVTAVESVTLHPEYRPDATRGDLALLRLATPAGATVDLPAAGRLPPRPGAAVQLLGWGATDAAGVLFPEVLQAVDVRVVADADCGDVTSAAVRVCAGAPVAAPGAGACTGDSGGPLLSVPEWTQIGVLSAGTDPCGSGPPDEYVEVAAYMDWITAVTGRSGRARDPRGVPRVEGATTEVAVTLSQLGYAADHPIAFVATSDAFPDGLAGGALAAGIGPLLLTPSDAVPASVMAELERLSPAQIIVFGGQEAVSAHAQVQLEGVAPVRRLAGADRYATAAAVASAWPGEVARVFVATGTDFPDALAAVPAAAGDGPVLLARPQQAPAVTRRAVEALAPDEIVLLGGRAALSDGVEETLAGLAPTRRLAGDDRYATAAAVATDRTAFAAPPYVFVTTGSAFADALVAGVAAVRMGSPLLLADPGRTHALRDAVATLRPDRIIAVGPEERLPHTALGGLADD